MRSRANNRPNRFLLLFLLSLSLFLPATLVAAERRTAVVEAVAEADKAVVNIRTEQIVQRRGTPFFGFGGGLFEEFFRDLAPPRVYTTESLGSGIVVRRDGLVLTNAHVIERGSEIFIALPGEAREIEAELVGSDPLLDLALLRLPQRQQGYPAVRLGHSDDLLLGETVVAIGNPLGLGQSITTGVVSGPLRPLALTEDFTAAFIQTDALINPGNSGGALINLAGEVIGINTAILRQAQGIGFAVPIDVARRVLPELEKEGAIRPAYHGLLLAATGASFSKDQGRSGVLVAEVEGGSPAALAGLQAADVVFSVDDIGVDSPAALVNLLRSYPPGNRARLEVLRGSKVLHLQLQLEKFPRTAGLDYLLRHCGFSLTSGRRNLVVKRVRFGSAAAEIGMQRGDLLLEVNGVEVASLEAVENLVRQRYGLLPLQFLVVRNGRGYRVELP